MMRHGMQSVISNCVDGGGETDLVQDLSSRYFLEIKMPCFQYPGGGTAEMLLDPLTILYQNPYLHRILMDPIILVLKQSVISIVSHRVTICQRNY